MTQGTTESSKKQKLFLMNWCPDSAKIKKKMLYASSFDNLKKSLVGVHKFIQVCCTGTNILVDNSTLGDFSVVTSSLQATDASEASEGEVEKQLRATDRV